MYEINLIGDIDSEVKEGYVNDTFLANELEEAKGQDLEIKINTLGGCVDTAFRMYDLLEDYKIKNKAVVTTITDQNCASSGIILLLAGNRRIVNNNTNPFIHEAWMEVVGTANYLLNSAFDLEDCNFKIAKLYAQKTALDYDEARELMGVETFFTPEEAYNLGFATELSKVYNKLDYKLIIKNKLELKTNINMANESYSKEEVGVIRRFLNSFLGKDEIKPEIKNKVVLSVSDVEIDFMEIDTDATPKVGDKANVDGKPAEGEYITKGGEKYSFEGGVLTEIEKEEEVVQVDEELTNQLNEANTTIEALNKQIESQKTKFEDLQTKFNKLTEDHQKALNKVQKFDDLESEFQKLNKKEQRETKEVVETKEKFNFSQMKNNLKQIKNN